MPSSNRKLHPGGTGCSALAAGNYLGYLVLAVPLLPKSFVCPVEVFPASSVLGTKLRASTACCQAPAIGSLQMLLCMLENSFDSL